MKRGLDPADGNSFSKHREPIRDSPEERRLEQDLDREVRNSGSSFHKGLLVSGGILCVGLATAGIFLPLLPTTPFLLLAAACFIRSSDRLYQWLIHHKWFGPYIRNYREHKAIPKRTKVVILLLLWGTLAYSAFGVIDTMVWRLPLLLIGIGVTLHVLRLKTLTPDMLSGRERSREKA